MAVHFTNTGIMPAATGLSLATWDPATRGSGMDAPTNGNLTAANNSTTNAYISSTTKHVTGKFYFELTFGSTGAYSTTWNVAFNRSAAYPTGYFICANVNTFWNVQAANIAQHISLVSAGDVLGCAVDFDAKLVWNKTDTDTRWNGLDAGDPAAGTNGGDFSAAVSGSDPFQFIINLQDAVGQTCTLNVNGPFHFAPAPTGFGVWT